MPVVRFKGNKLDPATINALVAGTLVNGSKPSAWWKRQSADFRNTFMDTVRTSMNNGESLTQAITRVTGGTIDGVTVPGIMKTTKGKAGALVATSMSAVTNEAALKSFQANNDVIKAVTQLSTLDNRTSDVCIAYSGQTWDINTLQPIPEMGGSLPYNGGPPRHFNCRSRLRPVTKSFKELGLDKEEFPVGTRASMDGQVPADITFDKWLKGKNTGFQNKLLGPRRAELWRNDQITLTQLVDMRGNPMTISQIEQKLGMKPKPSYNPATGKVINKPVPKKVEEPPKILPKSALKELADGDNNAVAMAEAEEAQTKARTLFNNTVAQKIEKADFEGIDTWFEMVEASPYIPKSMIDAAKKRIDDAVKAAKTKADKLVKDAGLWDIDDLQEFQNRSASLVVENINDKLVSSQIGKALGDIRKAKDDIFILGKVDKLLEEGKLMTAKQLLGEGATSPAKMKKLQEIGAAQKQIGELATKVNNFEPESWSDWTKFRASLFPEDTPKWVKDEMSSLLAAAEKNAEAIQFIKLAEKALDDLDLVKAKEIINGLPQSVGKKFELKAKLQELEIEAEKLLQQKIVKFQDKAKWDLMNKGFADDIIDTMDNDLKFFAEMKKGVWDEAVEMKVRLKAIETRDMRDGAIAQIQKINKQSKGQQALSDYHNQLPQHIRYNEKYNEAFEKQLKLAKEKAAAAQQDVKLNLFGKDIVQDADEFVKYLDIIEDSMKDVHKKLGKKQLEAKLTEIKAKIEAAKKGGSNVNLSAYVDDTTDYGKQLQNFLHGREIDKLDEAAALFKADGSSSSARSKLFDVLGGKTEEQKRIIKEYVHSKANPKNLPSGKNWNEAVADVITKHANNATNSDIMKLIDLYEEGLDYGARQNFRQTIFTRAKITSVDDLGVIPEGAPSPTVARLRKELDEFDPGEVPLPTFTAEEQMKAAKEWISYSDTADDKFLELALERGKTHLRIGKSKIEEGDRLYGPNSWGITPDEWDEWMKHMVPNLTKFDIALMNEYTGGMAKRINAGLYNGGTEFKNVAGARALNEALDKMPKYKGDVYRGTSPNGNWNADFVDARYQVGKTITERHFGSSATQEPASFGGPIQFFIKAKGKNGAIMGHIGQYGVGEMEVLWKAGTRFKVLRKKRDGQVIKVWMEEV